MTSGTSGSIRHADDLSMTTAPRLAASGASCLLVPPPAAKKTMSEPSKASGEASSTTNSSPMKGSLVPAERLLASSLARPMGNPRSSRMLRTTRPTAPVAPTTAMFAPLMCVCSFAMWVLEQRWRSASLQVEQLLQPYYETLYIVPPAVWQ